MHLRLAKIPPFLLLVAAAPLTAVAAGALPVEVDPTAAGDPKHLVLMIVYASVALGFSFLCSVAEAVLLSVSPSYIGMMKKEKKSGANLLAEVKNNIDQSLAAILTLNTIAHTVGAGGAGAEAAAYFGGKYVGVSMAILTLLILFLSEIIPKTIGAVFWRPLAPWTARGVKGLTVILFPFIFVSEFLTKMLTRGKKTHAFSREEFTALADIGAARGHLAAQESRILQNLFRFPQLCVRDIMTPRTVVYALQQDTTVHQVMEDLERINSFSRIPIYGENRDDMTGFVLKNDILIKESEDAGQVKLRDIKRELQSVKATTPLTDTFDQLLDNRVHLLLAVDDYGGMEGIVTLEDLVETLIGAEIVDEVDEIDDMRKLARKKWEERMKRAGISTDPDEDDEEHKDDEGHKGHEDHATS